MITAKGVAPIVPPPARPYYLRQRFVISSTSSVCAQPEHSGRHGARAANRASGINALIFSFCQWLCAAQDCLPLAQGFRWRRNTKLLLAPTGRIVGRPLDNYSIEDSPLPFWSEPEFGVVIQSCPFNTDPVNISTPPYGHHFRGQIEKIREFLSR